MQKFIFNYVEFRIQAVGLKLFFIYETFYENGTVVLFVAPTAETFKDNCCFKQKLLSHITKNTTKTCQMFLFFILQQTQHKYCHKYKNINIKIFIKNRNKRSTSLYLSHAPVSIN